MRAFILVLLIVMAGAADAARPNAQDWWIARADVSLPALIKSGCTITHVAAREEDPATLIYLVNCPAVVRLNFPASATQQYSIWMCREMPGFRSCSAMRQPTGRESVIP